MPVKEMQQRPPRVTVVEYTGTPESLQEVLEFMGLPADTEQQYDGDVAYFEQSNSMGMVQRIVAPTWLVRTPFSAASPIPEALLLATYEDVPASAAPSVPLPDLTPAPDLAPTPDPAPAPTAPAEDVVVDPTEDEGATTQA